MAAPLFHSNIDDPSPSAVEAEAPFRVSGELGEKQIKQLARVALFETPDSGVSKHSGDQSVFRVLHDRSFEVF